MRIILYTGKGGVGKTSVSAATAVRAAQRGYRTLVMSTDLAHSLADSLDVRLAPEPVQVAPNLWAQETDVYHNLRTHWGSIQEWLRSLLAWRKVDDARRGQPCRRGARCQPRHRLALEVPVLEMQRPSRPRLPRRPRPDRPALLHQFSGLEAAAEIVRVTLEPVSRPVRTKSWSRGVFVLPVEHFPVCPAREL